MRAISDAIYSLQRFMAQVLPEPWDIRTDLETGGTPPRPFALIEAPTADATTGAPTQRMTTFAATINLYLEQQASREAATDAALDLREQVALAVNWGLDPWPHTTDRIPLWSYDPRLAVQRVNVRGAASGSWRLQWNGVWAAPIVFSAVAADVQAALDPLSPGSFDVADRAGGVFDVYFTGPLAGVTQPLMALDTTALEWPSPFDVPPFEVKAMQAAQPAPWRAKSDYMQVQSFGQTTVHDPTDETLAMVAVDLRLTFARARPLSSNRRLLERITAVDAPINGCCRHPNIDGRSG